MLSFKDWLGTDEELAEARKPKPRPNNSIDAFEKEVEAIKADMEKYRDKKKKEKAVADKIGPDGKKVGDKPTSKEPPPGQKADQALLKFARIAMSNLRRSPGFYNDRGKLAATATPPGGKEKDSKNFVSEDDARKLAREVGIDFRQQDNGFTFDDFRRGVQFELSRDAARAPSLQSYPRDPDI